MSTLDIASFILQSPGATTSKAGRYTPSTLVYWSRFGLGILAALLSYGLHLKGSSGLTLAAFLYLLSIMVVRRLYYSEKAFQTGQKTVILGLGTYIFTWAALWIFLYSLMPY